MSKERIGDDGKSLRASSFTKPRLHGESANRPLYRLPAAHGEMSKWFQDLDTKGNSRITAKELQLAFESFQGKHYSDASCKFVVRLFDLDKNGGLDIQEFEQMYYNLKLWVKAFNTFDRNRTGYLEEKELELALKYMEINFSPSFIKFLLNRHDLVGRRITLDRFIVTCVQIQKFGEEFFKMDEGTTGSVTLKYEDFLEMILKCL